MKRWSKWDVLMASIVGIAAVAGKAVVSQPPVTPQSPVVAPTHQFAKLWSQAQPLVEKALGSKLDFVPQFRAIGVNELQSVPDKDLDFYIHFRAGHWQGDTLTRARPIVQQIVGSATVA